METLEFLPTLPSQESLLDFNVICVNQLSCRIKLAVSIIFFKSSTFRLALWFNNRWDAVVPSMIFYYLC